MSETKQKITLDYKLISNVSVADVDPADYPDLCDAFIESANYGDREMTDDELDVLNEDRDFVYEHALERLR